MDLFSFVSYFFFILLEAVINLLLPKVSYSLSRTFRPPSGRELELINVLLELEADAERRRV